MAAAAAAAVVAAEVVVAAKAVAAAVVVVAAAVAQHSDAHRGGTQAESATRDGCQWCRTRPGLPELYQ